MRLTRREAMSRYAAFLTASPLLGAQIPPVQEVLNTFEFETAAQRKLSGELFEQIAGGGRGAFDRITFRPRMMVNTTKLDLSCELFGQALFTPIIIGPTSEQNRFHPDGELAMVRGASAAKAVMVISSRSSLTVEQIASQSKTTLWYQVYPERDMVARAQEAVKCGCKAVCLTLGVTQEPAIDWKSIDQLRQSIGVPLLLKGILHPEEAQSAVERGMQGIVVSNYTGRTSNSAAAPIEMLPAIANAIAGKAPILIDGGFRRGSDILKALALGANCVLLSRAALWGLAAYGAEGVQRSVELLQTELARDMAMCGRPNLKSIDATVVKVHRL